MHTVATRGNLRAVVLDDEHGEQPDGDCYGAIVIVHHGYGQHAAVQLHAGHADPVDYGRELEAGIARWGMDWDMLERFLRISLGVVSIARRDLASGDTLLEIVSRDTCEAWGIEPEWWGNAAALADWTAWAEGECYGIAVQRRVEWVPTGDIPSDLTLGPVHTWETIPESEVWGYYGDEYAEACALEQLDLYTSSV